MSLSDIESQSFKIKDATSYDPVAAQFDSFTRALALPFADRMVSLAKPQASERILDVGTGTGIVALNVAPAVLKGKVVGIDLSEGMLATAQGKASRLECAARLEFCRMDAETLAFEDQSFNVVLSLFAVLHFPNPLRAFAEMFRVLRPGGRLVVAVGSRPRLLSLAGFIQGIRRIEQLRQRRRGKLLLAPAFLDDLVNEHVPASPSDEESALARGELNRTSGVLAVIREARFTNIRTSWYGHQALLNTPEDFWSIQSTFSSIARKRLATAPQDRVDGLRQQFFAFCHQVQAKGGRLVYPMGASFIKAERPVCIGS